MHHPGPPLFQSVGDWVELAPRDPDPDAAYEWRLAEAPAGSDAELGDDAVEYLHVDAPGTFVAELSAPDGTHFQTIRAFEGRPRDEAAAEEDSATTDDASDASADDGTAADRPDTVGPPAGVSGPEVGVPAGASGGSGPVGGSGGVLTGRREDADDDEPRHRSYAGPEGAAFPEQTGDGGRPRVQLQGRVDDEAVFVEAEPQPHPHGDETAGDLDVAFALDDRDDLERADVTVEGATLRIPLERLPERARVHAVAVGEHGPSVADCVDVRRSGAADGEPAVRENVEPTARDGGSDAHPEGGSDAHGVRHAADAATVRTDEVSVERPYVPPSWADDVVIYEVYVRTFASDVEAESEFDAIAEKFDHLEALGVDVLWLTPVLQNDHAPHGYNITDFYSIAEDLGDREDYRRFVERAHDRGFAVLFDLVCNHTARDHPYFREAHGNPDSEYHAWYDWRDSGEPETYFDWEYIANLDFSHLPVRRHLLDAIDQWAPLVDGFRVDMAWAVPNGFWRELRDRVKARDPEFLLLDETIPYIPDFQAGLFDVHFDSTTYAMLRSVGTGWADAEELLDAVDQRAAVGFPDHAGFMLYQENHDETRYRVECGRPASLAAAGALCTLPGSPLIYAGQELGQLGKRDDVVWDATDEALLDHYRHLTAARHRLPALGADASLERVDYDVREGEPADVVAFRRRALEGSERGASEGDTSERGAGAAGSSAPGESGADDGAVVRGASDTTPVSLGADDPAAVRDAVVVLNFAAEQAVVDLGPDVAPTDAVRGEAVDGEGGLRVDSVAVLPVEDA